MYERATVACYVISVTSHNLVRITKIMLLWMTVALVAILESKLCSPVCFLIMQMSNSKHCAHTQACACMRAHARTHTHTHTYTHTV